MLTIDSDGTNNVKLQVITLPHPKLQELPEVTKVVPNLSSSYAFEATKFSIEIQNQKTEVHNFPLLATSTTQWDFVLWDITSAEPIYIDRWDYSDLFRDNATLPIFEYDSTSNSLLLSYQLLLFQDHQYAFVLWDLETKMKISHGEKLVFRPRLKDGFLFASPIVYEIKWIKGIKTTEKKAEIEFFGEEIAVNFPFLISQTASHVVRSLVF